MGTRNTIVLDGARAVTISASKNQKETHDYHTEVERGGSSSGTYVILIHYFAFSRILF